ncbi:hypothetical protein BO86DRAFT_157330 [Aspergillus japonicus CBS 114.51]|uniref:Uncharacterized protein n=1 Tax=Aspergillus japonicus CBS 114.51 TaxID=1448312 RepID=A0A8T8WTX0_ASPJA|nr:hypothetical protein BO86DRAFT_157330 [Aspergillus japonicus CBS 114.51]RAH79233.1 hypothetical protein BO86DRAFT_157330 [Aspergillus japonicus CBS 114.51]
MAITRAQRRSRINVAGDACNRHVSTANSPGPSDATPTKDRAPTPESPGRAAEQGAQVPADQAIPDILTVPTPSSDRESPPPMRDITRYIDEVIDRGRDPCPQPEFSEVLSGSSSTTQQSLKLSGPPCT